MPYGTGMLSTEYKSNACEIHKEKNWARNNLPKMKHTEAEEMKSSKERVSHRDD